MGRSPYGERGCLSLARSLLLAAGFALTGFWLGTVPFGLLAARLRGIDIRSVGSGNVGATNVARALGLGWFLPVFCLDALKAFLPALACRLVLGPELAIPVAVAAVLGNTFNPWLRFRGGKSIAAAFGGLLAIHPPAVGAGLAAFLIVLLLFRLVSLGSILATLAAFGLAAFTTDSLPVVLLFGFTALFAWFTHRSNIKRILAGTEPKVRFGRNGQ